MTNVLSLPVTRRTLRLFMMLFIPATLVLAQSSPMLQTTRDQINLNGLAIPKTGTLFGIEGAAGNLIGNPYLDTTWQMATVKFDGTVVTSADSVTSVPVRLDLMRHDVEIRVAPNDIRSAEAALVQYVVFNYATDMARQFMNMRAYKGETDALAGFIEAIVTGKLTLLQYPWIYVKKSSFNAALNTGTKDTELVQRTDWYVVQNGQTVKFSPSKKTLLALMDDKKNQMEAFLKTEKPELKSRSGLTAVFAYYNGL